MENTKTIDYRFKILYAVGMILVVSGHVTLSGGISLFNNWFSPYSYHLALFVFCSGYFYKSSAEKAVVKYILKKIRNLIIPLYLYNFGYGLFVQVTRLNSFTIGGDFNLYNLLVAPVTDGHQFLFNMAGWFVVSLFLVEVYNILIRKCLKQVYHNIPEWIFFIISIALGITGNQLACMGYLEKGWLVLVRMLYFVPFYSLGYFYKTKLEQLDRKISGFWYFAVIFVIQLVIIYSFGKVPTYTPSWCSDFTEGPIMPIICGFLGIALWMRIANILNPVIGNSKWINLIADNSYAIMMNQFLGFMIVKAVYAEISKFYVGFSDFNWTAYKGDIFWYYIPGQISHVLIIYVVLGLAFPILLKYVIIKLIGLCRSACLNRKG